MSMLLMAIAARELSPELQPHHMALYRNVICLLLLAPFVVALGWQSVRTANLKVHIARNTVHFGAQWCWLFGLGALPLAEVFAVEFSAPIWAAVLAAIFLGERLTRLRIFAIALGFGGILILLRPGIAIIDPASIVVLGAALGYGIAYVLTKSLTGAESPLAVVFWMNVIQLPIGLVVSLGDIPFPSDSYLPWLALLGLTGLSSHYCLSQALRYADVSVISPLDFFRLPLAVLIAWIAYDEPASAWLLLGGAFILAGNWINLRSR
jgi:drug/metabolite transporter (DMT)-like permease